MSEDREERLGWVGRRDMREESERTQLGWEEGRGGREQAGSKVNMKGIEGEDGEKK